MYNNDLGKSGALCFIHKIVTRSKYQEVAALSVNFMQSNLYPNYLEPTQYYVALQALKVAGPYILSHRLDGDITQKLEQVATHCSHKAANAPHKGRVGRDISIIEIYKDNNDIR